MELTLTADPDVDSIASLIEHPSLAGEFEPWQGRVASALEDPFHPRDLTWIARDSGVPVGFALAYVLPGVPARFAVVRLGVLDSHRRQGLGARMLSAAIDGLRARAPDCREISMSACLPNPAAAGFAARHGFEHARYFWLMERPRGSVPEASMPEGVLLRVFDGSDAALRDLHHAYNASFAKHYHYIQSDLEDTRAFAGRPEFRRDGVALAYRENRCVGFCRNELFARRGEIAGLGTVPTARRIGLGRALLRWGVRWLEAQDTPRVTLLVDGENQGALTLYRSEGFEVALTKQVWSRA